MTLTDRFTRRAAPPDTEGLAILVLTRHLGEKIVLSCGVTILVVGIDRGKVRLGVETDDPAVGIWRAELLKQGAAVPPAAGYEPPAGGTS